MVFMPYASYIAYSREVTVLVTLFSSYNMAARPEPVPVALYTWTYVSAVPTAWDRASPGRGKKCHNQNCRTLVCLFQLHSSQCRVSGLPPL